MPRLLSAVMDLRSRLARRTIPPLEPAPQAGDPTTDAPDAVDSAWKIHAAVADWTGRVDAKASYALAAESAAIGVVLKLREAPGPYSGLPDGPAEWLYWAGIACLSAAILCALLVVRPRLRARHLRAEASENFLYFGHLRYWEPDALQRKLTDQSMLAPLCTNIINASKVAWVKHRCVQASLTLTVPASGFLVAAALLDT